MQVEDRNLVGTALHGGAPIKSYKKTTLGKVGVTVWNSFENRAEGLILEGNPDNNDDGCIIDVWTPDEDYYFKSKNKRHLQTGDVIEFKRSSEEPVKEVQQYNDDELLELLEDKFKKFFALQTLLNSTNSIPLLFRIKKVAQDKEKSDKVIKAIEGRISELQALEFTNVPSVVFEK